MGLGSTAGGWQTVEPDDPGAGGALEKSSSFITAQL